MADVMVYRIETPTGQGAYGAGAVYDAAQALGIDPDEVGYGRRHSPPYDEAWEGLGRLDSPLEAICTRLAGAVASPACVFGFHDPALADAWFLPEHRKAMVRKGGVVVNLYRVPAEAVVKGTKQCVFHKPRAVLVGTVDPVTLSLPT